MIDKKIAAIFALLVSVVVMAEGWYITWSNPPRVLPLPEGVENWTQYFRGYEAYLDREIYASFVYGTSMEPTLGENDLTLWVRVDPSELKVGDIIIFQHPTMPYIDNIVHRIVEVNVQNGEYKFRTKGDNLGLDQHWLPGGNVHGLVIGVVYNAGAG